MGTRNLLAQERAIVTSFASAFHRDLLGLGDLPLLGLGLCGLEPLGLCDFSRPPLREGLAERGEAAATILVTMRTSGTISVFAFAFACQQLLAGVLQEDVPQS